MLLSQIKGAVDPVAELSHAIKAAINDDQKIIKNHYIERDGKQPKDLAGLWYEPDIDEDGVGGDGRAVFVLLSQIVKHPELYCSHPDPAKNARGRPDYPGGRLYFVINPDVQEDDDTEEELDLWAGYFHMLLVVTASAHIASWHHFGFRGSFTAPVVAVLLCAGVWHRIKDLTLRNGRNILDKLLDENFFIFEKFNEETTPWIIASGLAIAYAHLFGILDDTASIVLQFLQAFLSAFVRPVYRAKMGLPSGQGRSFRDALPRVCEDVTRHPAAFWEKNPEACAHIFAAYEDTFVALMVKNVIFLGIFVLACYLAYDLIIQRLFSDHVRSVIPHIIVYSCVGLFVASMYSKTPDDLLSGWMTGSFD